MVYYGDYPQPWRLFDKDSQQEQQVVAAQQAQTTKAQQEQPIVEQEKSFFESKGIWLLLGGFFAYYTHYFTLQFTLAYTLIILAWGAIELGKKYVEQKPAFPYRPFELNEIKELESEILKNTGRRIDLSYDRFLGEPEFGAGSAEPFAMHFRGIEDSRGAKVASHVAVSLRTPKKRGFIRMERDHVHTETAHSFWTGSLKPTAPELPPSTREMIYVPSPTPITAVPSEEEESKEQKESEKK